MWLDLLGQQLAFHARATAAVPRTVRRYGREVVRLLAEVSFGSGALAVVGGTVGVGDHIRQRDGGVLDIGAADVEQPGH